METLEISLHHLIQTRVGHRENQIGDGVDWRKKGKTTYPFSGTTNSKGGAILTAQGYLAGYSVIIKFK